MVSENYRQILDKVNKVAIESDRNTDDVTLIAVSKTKPIELLKEAYEAGARDFGENKVQEIMDKYPLMPSDVKWHMIGHLQTNKVKYIVDKVEMIHSVDSLKLANEIDKQAKKVNRIVKVLIEVNVGEEDTKFGLNVDETENLVREIAKLSNVKIMGLMTVAPYVDDPEKNRGIFCALKQLSVDIDSKNIDNVNMLCLSMGMSGDYEVAISEGATFVRVGTSIFGHREYKVKE